ncbi:OmpP1/FadL family transporter [Ferrimonas pelagia]|uniref:TonB-dependent receptor n=1 Tax=Ferrimonas pelagia TaxID=1177826 RepID=A0ABP9ECP2_9GAMM
MKAVNKTLIALAVAAISSPSFAAGFGLNAQSATGVGRAISGDAAIGDNAAILARNPAGMALFDSKALSVGMSYLDVDVNIKDVSVTLPGAIVGSPSDVAVPIGSEHSAADNKFVPSIYYIQPINDQFAFGLAAFTNFGTGTDTSALQGGELIPGSELPKPEDLLGNTQLTTVNFNASLSYRINEMFSVGAGLDVIYGSGEVSRGSIPDGAGGAIQLVDVDADGIGFGGIVGGLIEFNQDHRIGFSYRFSPEVTADGTTDKLSSEEGVPARYQEMTVPLPDIFQIAGFHQVLPQLALHYTVQFTQWSTFDEITMKDGVIAMGHPLLDGSAVPNEPLKEYQWEDSWLYSVGATYSVTDQLDLRAGYMFDNGVIGELESISIPDSDRNWYTFGATYRLDKHHSFDFGYAYVQGQDVEVTELSAILTAGISEQVGALTPIYTTATTRSNAQYFSLQYNYSF